MRDEILDFIKRRFGNTDANWCNGNCYYFAVILIHRFPDLKIYYEPVAGHFVAGNNRKYYDANGLYAPIHKPVLFKKICNEDPLWAKRLERDCIT